MLVHRKLPLAFCKVSPTVCPFGLLGDGQYREIGCRLAQEHSARNSTRAISQIQSIVYLSIGLFVLHLLHAILLHVISVLGVLLSSLQSLQSFSHDLAVMLTVGKRALHLLEPLLQRLRCGIAVIQTK